MKNKTFNYKNNKNCSFEVSNYRTNLQSMAIKIVNSKGKEIIRATVNMPEYFYSPNTATIKNYSENAGLTKFLEKLRIIDTIYSSRKANSFSSSDETIDFCEINIDILKEYSSKFNYEFTY